MELIKYIILGILQGITEPLPVSSSGHIYVFKSLFNTNMFNDLNLEIFLNFASFIAILIIFRCDVINLIKGFFTYIFSKGKKCYREFKYCMLIVVGTIPVGILGLLIKDPLEELLSKNTFLVGFGFLITALALLLVMKSKGSKDDDDITYCDAIIIGLCQAIALTPGISRSGMTLVGCLLCGLNRKSSLKYTFMLYFPVSVVTMLLGVKDLIETGLSVGLLGYYFIGMIFAFIFTYIAYLWLSKIVEKGNLWKFSIYLIIASIFTILYFI
jgi:undecaprenyl-diphosphatase